MLFGALGYGALLPWLPNSYPQDHIIHFTDGSRYRIVGTVDSTPVPAPGRRLRLVLRVERLGPSIPMPKAIGRLRLTVFGDLPEIHPGDRLEFESRLRSIRNFQNRGSFDYRRHMAFKKITATAWVRGRQLKISPVSGPSSSPSLIYRARGRFRRFIESELGGDSRAVMKALTIGDRNAISIDLREVFNRCGIGHLLAISGLHVGIIAIVLMSVAGWLFNRFRFFLARGWGRTAAACATIPFIIAYGVMAGLAPSTQRAVIMVSLGLGAYLLRREGDTLNFIALAGLLILVWHPPMLFAIGFQMSFAAVLAIVLGLRHAWPRADHDPLPVGVHPGHRLLGFMAVSFYATAGTLPLLMYYFQQFSLIGLIANLIAVPLVGFVALPLGMLSLVLLPLSSTMASFCLQTGGVLLDGILVAARWASVFEFAALRSFQPTGWEIWGYYALLGALIAIRSNRVAKWALVAAVVFLTVDAGWWYHYRFGHDDLRLTVLDVGQGNAVLVEFPGGRTMLVDGGGYADNRIFDMGRRVIGPFLRRQKILTVDYLVLSHPSSDHMNGLFHIVRHFHPRFLFWNHDRVKSASGRAFVGLVHDSPLMVPRFDGLDRRMEIGGATIRILNPPPDYDRRRKQERWRNLNNNSLALQIAFGGNSILIPGDVERQAELEMVRRTRSELRSTILLAPHHGSRTSSSEAFLQVVAPELAIFSCGWRNRFGFPHQEILARYRQAGSRILRTDINGAVYIRMRSDGLQLSCNDRTVIDIITDRNG
ncbi:MAG: DNA internalization-related competence protein ComEC/Rec2 [Desulfosarcina sp.]|nr:DNA internalization-related competence protein ComEC/Rec2 [Desulfobacterales bacterium]